MLSNSPGWYAHASGPFSSGLLRSKYAWHRAQRTIVTTFVVVAAGVVVVEVEEAEASIMAGKDGDSILGVSLCVCIVPLIACY